MPDYGYSALAPAIGAQEGLATLLKQRLMERAQKLAELTQQQTAANEAERVQVAREGIAEPGALRREMAEEAARRAKIDDDRAEEARVLTQANALVPTLTAGTDITDTPAPGIFKAAGMGHLVGNEPANPLLTQPGPWKPEAPGQFNVPPRQKFMGIPSKVGAAPNWQRADMMVGGVPRALNYNPDMETGGFYVDPDTNQRVRGVSPMPSASERNANDPNSILQPEDAQFVASYFLKTGIMMPMGMGAKNRPMVFKAMRELAGTTGADPAVNKAVFESNKAALTAATKSYHFKNQYANQALAGMKNAAASLKTFKPTSRAAILNNLTNWVGRNLTGDPKLSAFEVFVLNTSRDYAKATMGGEASIQQLSDSASAMADRLINSAMSDPQFMGALGSMMTDIWVNVKASRNEVELITDAIKALDNTVKPPGAQGRAGDDMWDGVSPPRQGQIRVYPNQKRAQYDGTGWVQMEVK
jgi:hypothetical protein